MKSKRRIRKTATWFVALALILQMGFATPVMATETDEEPDAVIAQQEETADPSGEDAGEVNDTGAEGEEAGTEDAAGGAEAEGSAETEDGAEDASAPVTTAGPVTTESGPEDEPAAEEPDDPSLAVAESISTDGADLTEEAADAASSEVTFTVAYDEDAAGAVAEMVNELRTGQGLEELAEDENLAAIAMQRAAETAICWSHTRPDGTEAWSAYSEYRGDHEEFVFTQIGEAIACGPGEAEEIFAAWTQEQGTYADLGNRENILSEDYNAVGIACASYNDTCFWVLELADLDAAGIRTASGPAEGEPDAGKVSEDEEIEEPETGEEPGPAEEETAVTVRLADSFVDLTDLTAAPEEYSLTSGGTAELPLVSGILTIEGTKPDGIVCVFTDIAAEWTVADPSVAEITGEELTALSAGSTTMSTTVFGQELEARIEVSQSIDGCTFTFDPAEGTYDGTAQEPALTVTNGSITLTPEEDYTVSYDNNINAGTAVVTVTGAGNYDGGATLDYEIAPRAVTPQLTGTTTKVYDGNAAGPEDLTVELSDVVEGDDVSAAASSITYNSADAAEASVITASGITLSGSAADNYVLSTDTAQIEGTIEKIEAQLAFKADFSPDKTYDGKAAADPTLSDLEATEVPDDEIIFEWYAGESDSGNVIPAPTDAGTYTLVARVAPESNYTAANAELTVTIERVDYSPKALETTVTAGKAEKGIRVEIADYIQEGGTVGEPSVSGKNAALIDGTPEATETEVTFDTTSQKDGAAATITVPVTGCTNYNDYEITIEVTAVESETESEPDATTETGPGPAEEPEPDATTETEPGPDVEEPEPDATTETEPGPAEEPEPDATTETEPGPDEEEPEPDAITETEPGPVEPEEPNTLSIVGSLSMTYDGAPAEVEIDAEYGGNTADYTWTDAEGTVLDAAPVDVGTYSVEVSIGETADYEGATADAEYVIDPAIPTVTLEDKEAVYTGQVISIDPAKVKLENGESYNGTISYTYYTDEDCTKKFGSAAPSQVGTYYVIATVPAFGNYTAGESNIAVLSIVGQPSEGGIAGGGDDGGITDGLGGTTSAEGGHTGVNVPILILILALCAVAVVVIVLLYLRKKRA